MRFRITVRPTGERTKDLRVAANIRRDIWEHSPVEIDADYPLRGTHRDKEERPYFEFSTVSLDDVKKVLKEYGHAEQVDVRQVEGPLGQGCQNCGNVVDDVLPTVCPNCHFRDISVCPICHEEVPRQSYQQVSGNLFRCPCGDHKVRLRFNEPMFLDDGTYNQPLVVVEPA